MRRRLTARELAIVRAEQTKRSRRYSFGGREKKRDFVPVTKLKFGFLEDDALELRVEAEQDGGRRITHEGDRNGRS